MNASTQAARLEIVPHQIRRTISDRTPKYWFDGHPFKTHHFNALSSCFPLGELFFIKSVRPYVDQLEDGKLRDDVDRFIRQEGNHRIEHDHHVSALAQQGYGALRRVERLQKKIVHPLIKRFPRLALSTTVSVEHLTAVLSHEMLSHPERWIEPMHEDVRSIWLWHAAEEIEHKAVVFDVFQSVCGSHAIRAAGMVIASAYVYFLVTSRRTYFLWSDGLLWRPRIWRDGFAFLWGKHGGYRTAWRDLAQFFRRDFHPWQKDDGHLAIETWTALGDADQLTEVKPRATSLPSDR